MPTSAVRKPPASMPNAEKITEAVWVAPGMRAGAAFAHSARTLELLDDADER